MKTKYIFFAALCFVSLLSSCGDGETRRAEALYVQADSAYQAHNFARAAMLLDSMDRSCRGAVDTRRKGMFLRAQVNEGLYADSLALTDSLAIATTVRRDSLRSCLRRVPNAVEEYFVVSPSSDDAPLSVRMTPEGVLYLSMRLSEGGSSLTLTAPGAETVSVPLSADPELNASLGAGARLVTLMGDGAVTLAEYATANPSMVLNGKAVPGATVTALRNALDLMQAEEALMQLVNDHTRFEAALQTARNHAARTVNAANKQP